MAVRIDVTSGTRPPAGLDGRRLEELVARAAESTLEDRGVTEAELSIALLDDADMTAMNRQWRQKDAPTDVLAFALNEPGDPPLGDVYLGVEQAVRQAAELGEDAVREVARLTVHGTLHVLGFDHPDEGREDSPMWAHQERILERLDGV